MRALVRVRHARLTQRVRKHGRILDYRHGALQSAQTQPTQEMTAALETADIRPGPGDDVFRDEAGIASSAGVILMPCSTVDVRDEHTCQRWNRVPSQQRLENCHRLHIPDVVFAIEEDREPTALRRSPQQPQFARVFTARARDHVMFERHRESDSRVAHAAATHKGVITISASV